MMFFGLSLLMVFMGGTLILNRVVNPLVEHGLIWLSAFRRLQGLGC